MKMLMIRIAKASALASCLPLVALACNREASSNQDTAQVAQAVQTPNPNAPVTLRGTVTSVSANQLVLKTDTGAVNVTMTQPFHLYSRVPTDLSHVTEGSFIGVTTIEQPDGSQRATEIHVFPEELRGVGEGSRIMAPDTAAVTSRMTNGSVSASRMTNGTASPSRMSNGSVSSTNGSSLVVQYAGGSQNVTVPPNTPVTELKLSPKNIAVGDRVSVSVKKLANGSLTADRAISIKR
jgi:hypothetical protein